MRSRRPENGSRVSVWGYEFEWTADHLTAEELRPLIYSYDELATRCLDRFDDLPSLPPRGTREPQEKGPSSPHPEKGPEEGPEKGSEKGRPDLYKLLKEHAPRDETLRQLWDQVNTVPDWVDWAQIERGQNVFYRYAGPSIVGLTFSSLLGGMGSARVVETLTRTGGFNVKVARRRLLETLQHVLDVTDSLPGIQPGSDGKGFASSIRVRLLHASVRRRILALTHARPEYYSVGRDGVPINDLDSIGTIAAFSATLLWIAFPRQGIYLGAQEKEDYIALWRYLAHLLGTPTHPFSSARTARAWMESLMVSEIDPSETSKVLSRNMIQAIADQPPGYPSAEFLHAEAHWLNPRPLALALGIPSPHLKHTLLVAIQCLFFMALCYTRRSIARLDAAGIARARRGLRRVTLRANEGVEGRHVFRFVPSLPSSLGGGDGATNRGDGEGVEKDEGLEGEGRRKGEMVKDGVGVNMGGGGMMGRRSLALQAVLVAASVIVGWAVAWLTVT